MMWEEEKSQKRQEAFLRMTQKFGLHKWKDGIAINRDM